MTLGGWTADIRGDGQVKSGGDGQVKSGGDGQVKLRGTDR